MVGRTRMRARGVVLAALMISLGSIAPANAAVGATLDACAKTGTGDLRLADATGCTPVMEAALQLQGAGDASGLVCAGCVDASDVAAGAIGTAQIADGAVASLQIADGSVAPGDLAFDPHTQAEANDRNARTAVGPTSRVTADADPQSGYLVAATIGADGLPIMGYISSWGIDAELRILHCGDPGCSAGSSIVTVDPLPNGGGTISIAIGADGLPLVAWADGGETYLLHCGDLACAAGNTIATPVTSTAVETYATVVVDGSGLPAIAYQNSTQGTLRILRCGNLTCTSGNVDQVVDNGAGHQVGSNLSVALAPDGNLVMGYFDATSEDLRYSHCTDPSCFTVVTGSLDGVSGTKVGRNVSLAIGEDGLPVMAYVDWGNNDVKVLHCRNLNCSGFGAIVADASVSPTFRSVSLTIGPDGLPVVAYTGDGLEVFHCGTVDCSLGGTQTVVDAGGKYSASITLGADDRPFVAYAAGSISDVALTAARCTNPFCTSYLRRR